MVGEVVGDRHVGLPHAALHVEHGQGVGGAFVEGEFFVLIVLIRNFALLGECDWAAVEVDGFVVYVCCVSRTACFVGADIGGYGVGCSVSRLSKFQQAGRFTVRAADIQHQLTVNVDPHIIITGEEELNGDFITGIIPYLNLTVIRQCKVKLQLRTKAVVVIAGCCGNCFLIEGEETVGSLFPSFRIHIFRLIICIFRFSILVLASLRCFQIVLAFGCILLQIQRPLITVKVPVLGFRFSIAVILRKDGFLGKREGNILVHLAQHGFFSVCAG